MPPVAEVIPGFDLATIVGLFARAGTPQAVIDKITAEAIAAVKMPETQKQLAARRHRAGQARGLRRSRSISRRKPLMSAR